VIGVLHADDELVAVDKPAGIAMHRSSMAAREDAYLVDVIREQLGRTLYLAHRLDRATSGVVLLAASKETAAASRKTCSTMRRGPGPSAGVMPLTCTQRARRTGSIRSRCRRSTRS